ncbi:Hypothetical predicted protein [Mytilus galloprovincialis]|uniref:EGF-like domain-containing protein n=1 Tax=Mytilus galloprovincialis TaxID=29158 RepID=A0A8B6HIX8_MYTGA|nr:Hypothetical predicted protein [Mytilus galloprovincialis]
MVKIKTKSDNNCCFRHNPTANRAESSNNSLYLYDSCVSIEKIILEKQNLAKNNEKIHDLKLTVQTKFKKRLTSMVAVSSSRVEPRIEIFGMQLIKQCHFVNYTSHIPVLPGCTNGFGGERCETHASAHSQAQSSDLKPMITIVVPVVIGVVLILVILFFRRRRDQFKHQRMHNSNMEINNPIYRQQVDGEIEGQGSEIEPLDMEGVDHNTNFANPMYARLYTTDSTQVLLPKDSDSEEALDKNGDLNFYGVKGQFKEENISKLSTLLVNI